MIDYTDELRTRITANLGLHARRSHAPEGRKPAAVAIVIVDGDPHRGHDHDPVELSEALDLSLVPGDTSGIDGRMQGVAGGASFLLCRRAAGLNRHARQWALPGGRLDPGETPVAAALRELHEELGVELGEESVIGLLDDYPTRSGYLITPVVVWGGDPELRPAADEVRAVYRIGLHALRAGEPRFLAIPESDRPVVQIPLGSDLIHAPTGAVLLQFRWVAIEGLHHARVDHLEQPVFAWK